MWTWVYVCMQSDGGSTLHVRIDNSYRFTSWRLSGYYSYNMPTASKIIAFLTTPTHLQTSSLSHADKNNSQIPVRAHTYWSTTPRSQNTQAPTYIYPYMYTYLYMYITPKYTYIYIYIYISYTHSRQADNSSTLNPPVGVFKRQDNVGGIVNNVHELYDTRMSQCLASTYAQNCVGRWSASWSTLWWNGIKFNWYR